MVSSRALVVALSSIAFAGCHRVDPDKARAKEEFERVRATYEKRLAERRPAPGRPAEPPRAASATAPDEAPEEHSAAPASSASVRRWDAPWVADEPVEIAPPAQATATARGVVLDTRDGEILVAHLGRLAHGGAAARTPVEPTPPGAGNFGLGYGPSVAQDAVYWISHGSLVRRSLPAHGAPGPLQVLARDAFDG
ncbi:MAG TPA: hypothetical protein VHU80_06335, partial [Polyangiaceae bacterium]|nr:hypothetical protein [Polyangiaceae bacterium]